MEINNMNDFNNLNKLEANSSKPESPMPDTSPKPEIAIPSTTPLSNPASTPGVDRTHIMPEHDTKSIPEELPVPQVFPEVNPEDTPSIDENSPPTARDKIGFY